MIDVGSCNRKADTIDDAIIIVNKLIANYEEAIYYISRINSSMAETLTKRLNNELDKLYDSENNLKKVSSIIRSKAQEIYNRQQQEQQEREQAEAEATEALRI